MPTPRDPSDDLLQKLERATARGAASRRSHPLDDPELASLSEGWRVLDHALRGSYTTAPAALAHRVLQETERRRTTRRQRQWTFGLAAALVLSIAIGGYVFRPGDPAPVAAPHPGKPAVERRRTPEVIPVPRDNWLPDYLADDRQEPAVEIDPWSDVDLEIAGAQASIDAVQSRWRVTSTYLDYVARTFQEMELEMTVAQLF